MTGFCCVMSIVAALSGPAPRDGDVRRLPPAFRLHFRTVHPEATSGFVEMSRSPHPSVFVGDEDLFGAAEVLAVADASGDAVELSVSADVVVRLRATSPDRIAILEEDRLAGVARLEFPDAGGRWNLKLKDLDRVEASRLAWLLSEEANSRLAVSMVVVPPAVAQSAGSVVDVPVYLVGANSVGSYQFVVETSTPRRGWMRRDELLIDAAREDYVFRGLSAQTRIDPTTGALGATAESNEAAPEGKSVYLGTVRFRTSADAEGTFTVHIKRCPETFVKDKAGGPVLFNHRGAVLRFREPVVPRLEE